MATFTFVRPPVVAYSQGLISCRSIAAAYTRNVQFIAISGDRQPSHAHIAKFVVSLSDQIKPLFGKRPPNPS